MKYVKTLANGITLIALAFIVFSSFSSPAEEENYYSTTDAMLGEVRLWMGYYEPTGWRICDGREIEYQKNKALFQIIGTRFGGTISDNGTPYNYDDDTGTFKLPDLRGKRLIDLGVDNWDYNNLMGQYIICTSGAKAKIWDGAWHTHYDDGLPNPYAW